MDQENGLCRETAEANASSDIGSQPSDAWEIFKSSFYW
jgi:hypothetical protein